MRLFVSIGIPSKVKQNLGTVCAELEKLGISTSTSQLHCTLCFLGEVPQSKVQEITEKLARIEFKPFSVTAKGIGAFQSFSKPRVVWVGLRSDELLNLASQVRDTLGIRETRSFKPHVTLARLTQPHGLASLAKYQNADFGSFTVESFELKQSILSTKGPEHIVLKSFKTRDLS